MQSVWPVDQNRNWPLAFPPPIHGEEPFGGAPLTSESIRHNALQRQHQKFPVRAYFECSESRRHGIHPSIALSDGTSGILGNFVFSTDAESICRAYASPSALEISPSRFVSIQANTSGAVATPGVRSISRSTRPISMDSRVACRHSSSRCAPAGGTQPGAQDQEDK